jgi:hypothetical protein
MSVHTSSLSRPAEIETAAQQCRGVLTDPALAPFETLSPDAASDAFHNAPSLVLRQAWLPATQETFRTARGTQLHRQQEWIRLVFCHAKSKG